MYERPLCHYRVFDEKRLWKVWIHSERQFELWAPISRRALRREKTKEGRIKAESTMMLPRLTSLQGGKTETGPKDKVVDVSVAASSIG